MKVAIIFCLVATAMTNPLSGIRPGSCPVASSIIQSTRDQASRCQVDYDGNGLDYTCDGVGENTFKCCEYEAGIRICIEPVVVPEVIPDLGQPTDAPSDEEQVTLAIEKARDYITKIGKYPPPPDRFLEPITPNTIRWCVSNSCEKTKCNRMVSEFTYSPDMVPRKEWKCIVATSQKQCMFWIEQGWADIMSTREGDVFIANTTFDLKPIAYTTTINDENPEMQTMKYYQNVTFALKASTQINPNDWAELRDKTTCHAGVDMPASFAAPVLTLIKDGVIPPTGDAVESFADFVQESCVPGILNKTYNKNGNYPKNLVSLCEDHEMMYTGISGALRCLNSGKGQVTFFDHKIIRKILSDPEMRGQYMVVCRDESKSLDEDVITDESCHVGHVANPTIFISKNNTVAKETEIKNLLEIAMRVYGNTNPLTDFNLFDSSVYECPPCRTTGQILNKNVIFLEESNTLRIIDPSKIYAGRMFEAYNVTTTLVAKPRAKICVTNATEYEACLRFKEVAEKYPQVKDIAWGCVLAKSSMECMQAVHSNNADLFKANLMETFIGGKEMMLDPLMSVHRNTSITSNHIFTRTLAVIKATSLSQFEELLRVPEGQPKYLKDLWKLKVCSAGLTDVAAFHNPIGWLLANGTIPRIGSVFESINRYFQSTCVPGVEPNTWRWGSDLLLGHELNWGFPTLNMYNFTGEDWLLWNTPATWDYLTYNRKVTKGANIQKLLALKKMNTTSPVMSRDTQFNTDVLDDLLGVSGLSDLVKGLKQTTGGSTRMRDTMFRDRLSNAFPNFQGMSGNPLTNRIDLINRWRDARQTRVTERRERLDIPFPDTVREQFQKPLLAQVFSNLLELRTDKINTLEDMMAHIKAIPTMTDFNDEEMGIVFKHPAVMSYLQTYLPRISQTFVEMFDNVELREREFNRYTNPLWLSPKIRTFLDIVKKHQGEITNTCNSNLPLDFQGYEGSLRCLKSGVADVAFFDEQTLRNQALLSRVGFTYNDLRLICPNGQVVEIDIDLDIAKLCHFGEVMNPTLLTSYNTSGSWRWKVTKALMIAHQSPVLFKLFGEDALIGKDFDKLLPIDLLDQTYQTYLGPMVLRSFEAITKPSSYDYFKDQTGICYGETYTNVVKQRNDTCHAIVKDVTCVGEPRMKKISVGHFGHKQYKLIKMCSRPSKFVRKMAEFTCSNAHGYMKPVFTAVACECVPCEETIEFNSPFTGDAVWKDETNKYTLTVPPELDPFHNVRIWGNTPFFYDHSLSTNFELGKRSVLIEQVREVIRERPLLGVLSQINLEVDPEDPILLDTPVVSKTCEAVWMGRTWHQEWFPQAQNSTGSCVAPVPGANAKSRLNRFRETMQRRQRQL